MSIAKTAEAVKEVMFPKKESEKKSSIQLNEKEMTFASVPIDIFRYLDIELDKASDKDLERLKDINGWLGDISTGEKYTKLSELERKLGVRHFSESRVNRLWNYFKISGKISDLEKQREALSGGIRL